MTQFRGTKRTCRQRILLMTGTATIQEMLAKGNVWHVRHYEAYFDKVYVAYTFGIPHQPVINGNTTLLSLGTGRGRRMDLIAAPYRMYRLARRIRPTSYVTLDLVFSWWVLILAKILLGAKIYLAPVCMPEQIYRNSGRSLSGLPMWLERTFIKLSFLSSYRAFTSRNATRFIDWLSSVKSIRRKLVVIDIMVEELSSIEFYASLNEATVFSPKNEFIILYVGRLHREKMVADLIKMMRLVLNRNLRVRLRIIGDGPERKNLERLAINTGVREKIDFVGFIRSGDLADFYKEADVFASPLTGTSLREAALCELPVVAYDTDWVRGFLVNNENALLAEPGNVTELAEQVIRVLTDDRLRKSIADNLHKLALDYWRPEKVRMAMKQLFDPYEEPCDSRGDPSADLQPT